MADDFDEFDDLDPVEREASKVRDLQDLLDDDTDDEDEAETEGEEFEGALLWPRVPPEDVEWRLRRLRAWVEQLVGRYEQLDLAIIPNCWWQHNGHVELLQALMDHERASFDPHVSPATAMAWQRDFHFTETRLRELTSRLRCTGREHQADEPRVMNVDEEAFTSTVAELVEAHREATEVEDDRRQRERLAIAHADREKRMNEVLMSMQVGR